MADTKSQNWDSQSKHEEEHCAQGKLWRTERGRKLNLQWEQGWPESNELETVRTEWDIRGKDSGSMPGRVTHQQEMEEGSHLASPGELAPTGHTGWGWGMEGDPRLQSGHPRK